MREHQLIGSAATRSNKNENWAAERLATSAVPFNRQRIWGGRIFDFWNHEFGIAVEVDGPEHKTSPGLEKDKWRDRHCLLRSRIIVIRVENGNEEQMESALVLINTLSTGETV